MSKGKIEESSRVQAKTGNLLFVHLRWRGRYYAIKMFFPNSKVPNKKEVEYQIDKVYPGSKVTYFSVIKKEPGDMFLHVGEDY